ncbi:hypothetical protein SAMN05444955_1223 [Lihuaxuella thermophila]|uniref:Uncharacterized protein n=1 Tax=Lihuaxuella thermophila TaxID=1173111 RepID=A0A1H8J6P4_9BACL|nr:hypothetical protein SAMN05444955_1223 [Lihuaxuella thermophila]
MILAGFATFADGSGNTGVLRSFLRYTVKCIVHFATVTSRCFNTMEGEGWG